MTWRYWLCASLSVTGGAACGTDEANDPAAAVEAGPLGYDPCPPEAEAGEFLIELAPEYTSVDGKVYDGVPFSPPRELMSDSSCRLLGPAESTCDPECARSTQVCGAGGMCMPAPRSRDVGTVTVEGFVVPLSMTPSRNQNYSAPPGLPHPAFEAGADITLRSSGGDYPAFLLRGWGVTPFTLTTDPIRVDSGSPTQLSWEAPADPGPARIFVRLEINLHGTGKAWIECDFPDTGAAEIPAQLIDGLIAEGVSGFPTINAMRRTASSVAIEPGCVELLVSSPVALAITLDGLTSCNDSEDCPAGQLCRPELFCE